MPTVQMVVGVLSLVGLLYVAAAFNYHRTRLGYIAVGMLIFSGRLGGLATYLSRVVPSFGV